MSLTRREVLIGGMGLVVGGGTGAVVTTVVTERKEKAEEISAPEDLMREHSVLNRLLLIYEKGLQKLHANQDLDPAVFQRTAMLVRNFVENYHEHLEEQFVFPEFERRNQQLDLIQI